MKNKISKILSSLFILFSTVITVTNTNAKYILTDYSIAWENHFSFFTPISDAIKIEPSTSLNDVDNIWGGVTEPDQNLSIGNKDLEKTEIDGVTYYTYGTIPRKEGFLGTNATENVVNKSVIENTYGDYMIGNLNNFEISIVNVLSERIVIGFSICFYSPKGNDEMSLGVYNTLLASGYDYGIKVEFIENKGEGKYSQGVYNNLVEVPLYRTSGPENGEIRIRDGLFSTTYYPHNLMIEPFDILYNSGNPQPTGHYVDGATATNPASYKYPAKDYNTGKLSTELLSQTDLHDFILEPNEVGSFNLTLTYGNINTGGSSSSSTVSFVSSLDLMFVKESDLPYNIPEKISL